MENFNIVKSSISSIRQKDLILEDSIHNLFTRGPEQTYTFNSVLSFLNENSKIK